MSEATRLTEEGQATIPKELREKYDLEPGDEVIWLDTEDGIVVRKHTRSAGRGLLVPDGTAEETRESISEELAKRLRARRDEVYDGD
jgi:AbrB family looped-hinge helix DNA binding protein